MTAKNIVSVSLTPKLRLEQALKDAGVKDLASVTKLTIGGTVLFDDFEYIGENLGETLEELNMEEALIEEDGIPTDAFDGCTGLDSIVLPKTFIGIPWGLYSISSDLTSVKMSGMSLYRLMDEALFSEDDGDDDENEEFDEEDDDGWDDDNIVEGSEDFVDNDFEFYDENDEEDFDDDADN